MLELSRQALIAEVRVNTLHLKPSVMFNLPPMHLTLMPVQAGFGASAATGLGAAGLRVAVYGLGAVLRQFGRQARLARHTLSPNSQEPSHRTHTSTYFLSSKPCHTACASASWKQASTAPASVKFFLDYEILELKSSYRLLLVAEFIGTKKCTLSVL